MTAAGETKQLHVAVDYNVYVMKAKGRLRPENIDAIMARLAELGINRVYWIHHAEDYIVPQPLTDPAVDIIERAVEAAHGQGLSLYLLFKPFETGQSTSFVFPPGVAVPQDAVTVDSISGTHGMVAPFVAKHPEYRLKHRPPGRWQDREIAAIKLVKSDAKPTRLAAEDVEVYTSEENGRFERLPGVFEFTNAIEQRDGTKVRVLTLSGLRIPASRRYVLIRADAGNPERDFGNATDKIIELYAPDGEAIPFTLDEGDISRERIATWLGYYFPLRYGRPAEPGKWIPDWYGATPTTCAFAFDEGSPVNSRALRRIAVVKGKNEYLVGAMHPVYPEVRRYWIDEILERGVRAGVDGIDIRLCSHSGYTSEGAMYGFNEPVAEEYRKRHGTDPRTEPYDPEKLRQLNGETFTLFLRELRAELKQRGVPLQMHVNGLFRRGHFRAYRNQIPGSFDFDWRTWIVDDIVDSIALKYLPWPRGAAVEGVGDEGADDAFRNEVLDLARKHGKPVFDNVRLYMSRENVLYLAGRLRQAWEDPRVDGAVLYEGPRFVQADAETGEARIVPLIREILAAAGGTDRPRPAEGATR